MGIHIAWEFTDTPLELPLTGFPVDGEDLLEAVQDWIGGIGYIVDIGPGHGSAVSLPPGLYYKNVRSTKSRCEKIL